MIIVQAEKPLHFVYAVDREASSLESFKIDARLSNEFHSGSFTRASFAHYTLSASRKSQIARHTVVQGNNSNKSAQEWQNGIEARTKEVVPRTKLI